MLHRCISGVVSFFVRNKKNLIFSRIDLSDRLKRGQIFTARVSNLRSLIRARDLPALSANGFQKSRIYFRWRGEGSWRSRARIRMQREQRLIVAACTRTRHVKTRAWRLDFFSHEPRPRCWINEARGNFRFREENEPHDKFFDPYSSFLFFSHRQLIINFIKLRFEGRVYWLIEKNKKEKMEKKRNGIKNGGEKRRIYGGKIVNCDWLFKLQLQKKKEIYREATRLLLSIGNAIARAISHGWNRARCVRAILR